MRALVTGGAGFIGSHLVDRLLAAGWWVVALDDLSAGRRSNLSTAAADVRFRFVEGSALDADGVERLVAEADAIFHLAAAVGVRTLASEPVRTIETNLRGTATVLAAASRHRCRTLVTSSSEVYGRRAAGPSRETDDLVLGAPPARRPGYAAAKLAEEFLAMAHGREHGLPIVLARLFNTVGPRQIGDHGMVLPRLVAQALAGGPLTVYGTGRQTRSFCHVADVVEALVALATTPACVGQVFNVGGRDEIAIGDLAGRIRDRLCAAAPILRVPLAEVYGPDFEDIDRRVPDTTRLHAATGWTPRRDLDAIIDDVAAALRALAERPPTAHRIGAVVHGPHEG